MYVAKVVYTYSNGTGKPWDTVWIPYHDGIYVTYPIPMYKKGIRPKYLTKESMGIYWNRKRALFDRDYFIKWYNDVTTSEKPRNINIRFLINGLAEDINIFRRIFQEIIQIYSPKA